MLILVVNCGSSSAKYDLFDVEKEASLCRGSVERIGEEGSSLTHESGENGKIHRDLSCPDHHRAIEIIRDMITDPEKGVLKDVSEVTGVGHRVVHGGEKFNTSTLINAEVIDTIERFVELAPLHNPPSLEGIRGCMKIFSGVPQVAVFDTAFHQSMPDHAFTYGIPYELYEKYRIRKYGFHGTSHRYVARKAAEELGRDPGEVNLITVHLGNGCSIAAVQKGKSVDTSMGFTPLEGLLMGTRSGDLDPALVTFLMQREDLSAEEVNDLMNKKSGLLGLSGISNDMRDILGAIDEGNARAELAYDVFVYRIKKYIGSYAAVLGRVDAVVLTAGIGENVPRIKEQLERELNPMFGGSTRFMSIGTNEELLIAKDTYKIVNSE
ncbi:MAG: acetate/propionate family kinase [Candidatus Omnitrophica bacterium]|nr:acetate/propionate family kinase [Candidatus Omnitrophota bacterium]